MSAFDPVAQGIPDLVRAARVVGDPEWLPHSFNPAGDALVFLRIPAELRRSAAFLDGQAVRSLEKILLPLAWVQQAAESISPAPVHFIFHTALCGSTMLARALEGTGSVAGLKEPAILLNIYHRFSRGREGQEGARLDLILRLLRRPVVGTQAVMVKPSCFVNPLIPHIMVHSPESKAVFLSSDLRSFLLGIAKRGAEGRSWGRRIFASCRRAIPLEFGFGTDDLLQQTDLQVAGLAWLMRRWLFDRMSAQFGPDRTLQLQSDRLFESPVETLEGVSGFFGLPASPEGSRPVAVDKIFQWHSKEANRKYGTADRKRDLNAARAMHGAEVEPVVRWIEALVQQHGIRLAEVANAKAS